MKKTTQRPTVMVDKDPYIIRSALFQIIRECNFSCNHCSQNAPLFSKAKPKYTELNEIIATIRRLKSQGLKRIRFTGGEPLLHPQFLDIVEHSVEESILVSLVTNGSLLRKYSKHAVMSRVNSVWISLYGVNNKDYRETSNRTFSEYNLSCATTSLTNQNVEIGLYCSINLSNVPASFELVDCLVDAGARQVKFIQLMEQGRYLDGASYTTSNRGIRNGLSKIQNLAKKYPHVEFNVSMRSGQKEVFEEFGCTTPDDLGCNAGSPNSWAIDVNCNIHPCCLSISSPRAQDIQAPVLIEYGSLGITGLNIERGIQTSNNFDERSCFVLESYNKVNPMYFVCPLKYVRLSG